jgi:putative membrane protein
LLLHGLLACSIFQGFLFIMSKGSKSRKMKQPFLTNQFKIMERRLWYIITWPSAILTILFAAWLLILIPEWLTQPWMHLKLFFVALLLAYHMKTHKMFLNFQNDRVTYSSMYLRIWNEGATLLLFAIVFLVILKDSLHWIPGVLGFLGLAVVLFFGIRLFKKIKN